MASTGVLPMPSADFALRFSESQFANDTGGAEDHMDDENNSDRSELSAQTFFADAMAAALRNSVQSVDEAPRGNGRVITYFPGYEPQYTNFLEHQSRIQALGMRNTVSAKRTITPKDMQPDMIGGTVKELVHGLLSVDNLQKFGFDRINSNEPVILISIPESEHITSQSMRSFRDLTRECLRDNRGCAPVRIYVRLHPASGGNAADFLELALLNVANAEIGGPSMVQLLDAFFYREEWKARDPITKAMTVSKEAWTDGGWELVWRAEADPGNNLPHSSELNPTLEPIVQPEDHEPEIPTEAVTHGEVQISPELPPQDTPIHTQTESESKPESDDEPVVAEHPAMAELREREASRPAIQYPSWNRDESKTLLDLIRQQSSTVKDTPEDVKAEEDGCEESTASAKGVAAKTVKSGSEDSFELV